MDRIGAPELIILMVVAGIGLCMSVVMIIPYWKIYTRTGQPGAMALLQLVPLVNIVMLYVLAFSEWPVEREMRAARERGPNHPSPGF